MMFLFIVRIPGRLTTYGISRQLNLALSFLIDFLSSLSAIPFFFKKIIQKFQFPVPIEISPKNTFLPYHHLLWALQLRSLMHENYVPGILCLLFVAIHTQRACTRLKHSIYKLSRRTNSGEVVPFPQNFRRSYCEKPGCRLNRFTF